MIAQAASDTQFSALALVALVALLVAALVWWQRSRGSFAGSDGIRLVSVRALGGKRLLALVEVERERFLLGLTEERIACLARVAAPGETPGRGDASGPAELEQPWAKQSA